LGSDEASRWRFLLRDSELFGDFISFLFGVPQMKSTRRSILLLFGVLVARPAAAIMIETVPIGNVGNANDPDTDNQLGEVDYFYRIGKYEVTVGQYTSFLNSVAATDIYGLYNPQIATDPIAAGIVRNGVSGSYQYRVINSPNHPITFVSWGDAARFTNWLNNGQPSGPEGPGTTETGAYTLNGAVTDAALTAVSRNPDTTWFLPSASEWHKAAYFQPASDGGDTDNYWRYPMRTNTEIYSGLPPGMTPDNTKVGNFFATGAMHDPPDKKGYLTDVGAYTLSPSYYGTFDQGGNVCEWTEATDPRLLRGGAGGGWNSFLPPATLQASFGAPSLESNTFGFRVATLVPEPRTIVLAMMAFGSVALSTKR
jgi:sulfatase modifying factor 1